MNVNSTTSDSTGYKSVLLGGFSGVISSWVTAPVDRMNILFQLSQNKMSTTHLFSKMRNHSRKLGVRSLWWGSSAQLMKTIPFNAIRFYTFDYCQERLEYNAVNIYVSGSIAGIASVVTTYPLDLARTRMASQKSRSENKHIIDCLRQVVKQQGYRALYRGILPSLAGIVPYSGTSFLVNEQMKKKLDLENNYSPVKRLVCGSAAGFSGIVFSFPFDIIRRRMQRSYSKVHMVHVIKQVFKEGGFFAFYKGFGICWINSTIAVAISFSVYDMGKKFFNLQQP